MKYIAPLILMLSLNSLCMSTVMEDGIGVKFQVVTVDKKPIEGADVELIWPYKNPDDVKGSKKPYLKTVTDEKGWLHFEMDNHVDAQNYNYNYLILVRKEGFSIGWESIFTNNTLIVLSPLSRFSGKVVDLQGRPVPDAHVNALSLFQQTQLLKTCEFGELSGGKFLEASDILKFMSTQTDDDGRFLFDMFPEGFNIELGISKEGYADYYTYQLSEELSYFKSNVPHRLTGKQIKLPPYRKRAGLEYTIGMTDVIFTLRPPGTIQGVVIDSKSEKPLRGIPLSLSLDAGHGNPDFPAKFRSQIPCVTDTKGKFIFCNLEKGSYILSLDKTGHTYVRSKMDIEISEGQNRNDILFALTQGGTLNIDLLDSATQEGISDCTVHIETPDNKGGVQFHTDGKGKLVRYFLPGTYKIQGFEKRNGYGIVPQEHIFSIKDGQTTSMSLELQEYPKTTVVVKDPDGNPVRDFEIRFLRHKKGDYARTESWQKDDRSGFTVWFKSPTESNEVIVQVCDYRNNLVGITPLSIPGKEVSLTLHRKD